MVGKRVDDLGCDPNGIELMPLVKILARIGEFDETYLPNLEAIVEKAAGRF